MKGMQDLFYKDILLRNWIYGKILKIFYSYGYLEIQTPVLEELDLFFKSVGGLSDIILSKEIYTIAGLTPVLSLRPEGTAGVVRALFKSKEKFSEMDIIKVFYKGLMFRHDRPQRGRMREFSQIGAELFGVYGSSGDIEIIAMINCFLKIFSFENVHLKLNSLGYPEERDRYNQILLKYLEGKMGVLCEYCCHRFANKNALRILDCKNKTCKEIVDSSPSILTHLGDDSLVHFEDVKDGLKKLSIPFVVDNRLVRGLDYYTRTVFEYIVDDSSGFQSSVVGGGRYDFLVQKIAGLSIPAVGFAAGVERIELLIKDRLQIESERPNLSIVYVDLEGRKKAFDLLYVLRDRGYWVDCDMRGGSVRSQMRRANKLRSRKVLVLGANEIAQGFAIVKDMDSKSTYTTSIVGDGVGII